MGKRSKDRKRKKIYIDLYNGVTDSLVREKKKEGTGQNTNFIQKKGKQKKKKKKKPAVGYS